jgi:hypothetical protein
VTKEWIPRREISEWRRRHGLTRHIEMKAAGGGWYSIEELYAVTALWLVAVWAAWALSGWVLLAALVVTFAGRVWWHRDGRCGSACDMRRRPREERS